MDASSIAKHKEGLIDEISSLSWVRRPGPRRCRYADTSMDARSPLRDAAGEGAGEARAPSISGLAPCTDHVGYTSVLCLSCLASQSQLFLLFNTFHPQPLPQSHSHPSPLHYGSYVSVYTRLLLIRKFANGMSLATVVNNSLPVLSASEGTFLQFTRLSVSLILLCMMSLQISVFLPHQNRP